MHHRMTQQKLAAVCLAIQLAFALGCGSGSAQYDKLMPAEQTARATLETALKAWQDGQRIGTITGAAAPIEVMDSKWRAGQKLERFEILEAEPASGGPIWFKVRLTMKSPAGQQQVRYVVVGKSPLWVYREEDYKQVTGM